MILVNVSGIYKIKAMGDLQEKQRTVNYVGQMLLIQVWNEIVGRASLIEIDDEYYTENEFRNPNGRLEFNYIGKLTGSLVPPTIPLEGSIEIAPDENSESLYTFEANGEVNLIEREISMSLDHNGSIELYSWFNFAEITKDEIWKNFFRYHLISDNPSSLWISYDNLRPSLNKLLDQYDYSLNIFIMMRFHETKQNQEIREVLSDVLSEQGLNAQFADNISFAENLWENVQTYMLGCRFGIAIIEEIEERSFNPNVAIEIGFMQALQKRLLILKDKRVPKIPSDLIGKIYREFDSYNIEDTIKEEVCGWIEELRLLGELPY